MGVPVIGIWQRLINAVVKVFVVGKDDMATNVVELDNVQRDVDTRVAFSFTYKALGSDVCRGQASGYFVRVNDQPRRSILLKLASVGEWLCRLELTIW